MSALEALPARMSGEDYLRWEADQEDRYELVDGRPVMMAGGTRAHQRIGQNLAFALRARLSSPCFALQEQKVVTPEGNYRYPDVTVDCGAKQSPSDLAATEPRVVIEVESPSNTTIEEFERFNDFQSIPSMQQIVIVSQTKAKARIYTRDGAGWRAETLNGLDAALDLSALGCALPLSEIYEGVELGVAVSS